VPGDSLSKIARKFYGNSSLWPKIYQANKALIGPNRNFINPGQNYPFLDRWAHWIRRSGSHELALIAPHDAMNLIVFFTELL
jgi:hypothetical protein